MSSCTDGAKVKLGKLNGVVAHMKQKNIHRRSTQCCLYQQTLAVKKTLEEFFYVLKLHH